MFERVIEHSQSQSTTRLLAIVVARYADTTASVEVELETVAADACMSVSNVIDLSGKLAKMGEFEFDAGKAKREGVWSGRVLLPESGAETHQTEVQAAGAPEPRRFVPGLDTYDSRILSYFDSFGSAGVTSSVPKMAGAIKLSVARVRRGIKTLAAAELLAVEERHDDRGGRLESSYTSRF